ncbi:MAG: protein-(glutamine-N5) methyltransferase, release factor-specific [Alphaproteobacteria bacterium]|nr:MAG: protein-(glutamine-N5) methyltransferase, release factor-specific [Alphaproteobacteria bacterium]
MSALSNYSLKPFYDDMIARLKGAGVNMPDLDARFIIEERTPYDWSDIIARPDSSVTQTQHDEIIADINARIAGKPLSRIYGCREFWGLAFLISEDTLDPRPDSELIIDVALKHFPDRDRPLEILDLGTGSGCLLISLLSEFKNARGWGVDLSSGAVKCAKENAHKNHVAVRAQFSCGSWLNGINKKFDLIVSNPPYISNQVIPTLSKEVRNHDPILALDGGDDGLDPYKELFPQLKNVLNPDGIALFEIGYDQEKDVMRLAEDAGFAQRTVHFDLAGNPRVVDISGGDK